MLKKTPNYSQNFFRDCKLFSIIDGSEIDLTCRRHLSSYQKTKKLKFLKKRNHHESFSNFETDSSKKLSCNFEKPEFKRKFVQTNLNLNPKKICAFQRKKLYDQVIKTENYSWNGNSKAQQFRPCKGQIHSQKNSNNSHLRTNSNPTNRHYGFQNEPNIYMSNNTNLLKINLFSNNKYLPQYHNQYQPNNIPNHPFFKIKNDIPISNQNMPNQRFSSYPKPSLNVKSERKENPKKIPLEGHMPNLIRIITRLHECRKDPVKIKKHTSLLRKLLNNIPISDSNLSGLKEVLSKFLTNKIILPEDIGLSNLEIILFTLYLTKKKFKKLYRFNWTSSDLNILRQKFPKKRSEQNYKVILKRFFKKVITDFNLRHGYGSKNEDQFYRHYFEDAAKSLSYNYRQLKFQKVFNETKVTRSKKGNPRHSKKIFARVLNRCPEFMKMMKDYMQDELKLGGGTHGIYRDYSSILDKKLTMLLFKWRQELNSKKDIREQLTGFIVSKLLNDKVKLPWSNQELSQGIQNVQSLFNKKF